MKSQWMRVSRYFVCFPSGPKRKSHDSQRRDRILRDFSAPILHNFLQIFGESRTKLHWRNSRNPVQTEQRRSSEHFAPFLFPRPNCPQFEKATSRDPRTPCPLPLPKEVQEGRWGPGWKGGPGSNTGSWWRVGFIFMISSLARLSARSKHTRICTARLSRVQRAVVPSKGVQIWVCWFLYGQS